MNGETDEDDDWETDSGDEVEEEEAAKCLFSDDVLPSVSAALERDAVHHGFDLNRYVKEVMTSAAFFPGPGQGPQNHCTVVVERLASYQPFLVT